MQDQGREYVGFWPRVGASILDAILIMIVTFPPLIAIYGWDYFTDERESRSLLAQLTFSSLGVSLPQR